MSLSFFNYIYSIFINIKNYFISDNKSNNNQSFIWKNNYVDARNIFRDYTLKKFKNYNKQFGEIYIDSFNDLSVDYLFLNNNHSQNLHIIISGTHGVEGYCGSALQFKTLDYILQNNNFTQNNSYLFIHALNPYGYFHNRRFTKNNIDLNRNYLNAFYKDNYPQKIAQLINTYVFSLTFIYLFFNILFNFGFTKAREYIVKGQYTYQKSLFYGGDKAEYNIDVLQQILDTINYQQFKQIYIFDIHTGLGKYGNLSIMVNNHTFNKIKLKIYCNKTTKFINISNNNMYKNSIGSIVDGIYHYIKYKCYQGDILPIILEYGTYSNLQIFFGLLFENYYFWNNNQKKLINSQNYLKNLFYVNKNDWKNLVLNNYENFIKQI